MTGSSDDAVGIYEMHRIWSVEQHAGRRHHDMEIARIDDDVPRRAYRDLVFVMYMICGIESVDVAFLFFIDIEKVRIFAED